MVKLADVRPTACRLLAALAVADQVKPEAAGVVNALQRAGLACHMLTGDNWITARTVAAQLGIYNITAEVTNDGRGAAVFALGSACAASGACSKLLKGCAKADVSLV